MIRPPIKTTMTATSPPQLPVPSAAPPNAGRGADKPASGGGRDSFAQTLARQRAADPGPAALSAGQPGRADRGKAVEGETAPGIDAGQPDQAQDQEAAQAAAAALAVAAPTAPALPAQAIEIAAHAARLQQAAAAPAPAAPPALAAGPAATPMTLSSEPAAAAAPSGVPATAILPDAAAAHPRAAAAATTVATTRAMQATAAPGAALPQAPVPHAGTQQLAGDEPPPTADAPPGVPLTAPLAEPAAPAAPDQPSAMQAALALSGSGRPDGAAAPGQLGANPPLALSIATPLSATPAWGADLGHQLVVLSHESGTGHHTAELRLDPPDLGPLRVTLSVNDGVASASFVSAHAAVRHAVEAALPQLQQALAQAGLSLGQASVGDHGAQSGSDMQQQARGQAQGGHGESPADAEVAVHVAGRPARPTDGLVDTFA